MIFGITTPASNAAEPSTQGGLASFGITFDRDTEVTGYMKVKLWVSAMDADDMDLFITSLPPFRGEDIRRCHSIVQDAGKGRSRRAPFAHGKDSMSRSVGIGQRSSLSSKHAVAIAARAVISAVKFLLLLRGG